jgi:hypothetical protein
MTPSEIGIDIPDLAGYTMHRQIIGDTLLPILLSFFKVSDDQSQWFDMDVLLINARMGEAHFEFGKAFPPMVSYRIENQDHNGEPMKILHVEFEKGSISFSYEKAVHIKKVSPGPGSSSQK